MQTERVKAHLIAQRAGVDLASLKKPRSEHELFSIECGTA